MLIVISGSSAAGKDAIINKMKQACFRFNHVVTFTTRGRRDGEVEGVDYHFVTRETFRRMLDNDEFLEHAEVYGNSYGVPKASVLQSLDGGMDTIVRVDVQGASTIRKLVPEAILIFVTTPSICDYQARLKSRQSETDDEVQVRLAAVEHETKAMPIFDYLVVNEQGKLDEAVGEVMAIITAERCRLGRRLACL